MKMGTAINVKRIEIRPPDIVYPERQHSMESTKADTPMPSPTMPPLEDADVRFLYYGTSAMEVFLPIETKAKLIQTFQRLDQNTTVLPHVVELAINDINWPKTNEDTKRPERGKSQDSNSLQQIADMGSHGKNQKSNKKHPDTHSRLKTRDRMRKIANKKRQESSNDHREHQLLDQDIVHHTQSIPTTAILGTPPPEPKHNNATNDKYGHVVPERVITIDSSSEVWDSPDPDPRGQNGDSSDDDYKEDPFDLWALRQRQLSNKDPKFEVIPWLPDGNDRKSERSSWLPAHPGKKLLQSTGSKLLQCNTCGRWAYVLRCNQEGTPQTPPTESNDNVKEPTTGEVVKKVIYNYDEALPYYEYSEGTNTAITENRAPCT